MKERLLKWVQQLAMTLDSSSHFTALKNGIQATIPATIIGGLLCIITSFPVPDESATGAAASILKAISSLFSGIVPYASVLQNMSLGIIALWAVIGISYYLSKNYRINELTGVTIGVMTFLLVAAPAADGAVSTEYLGSKGLFSAIIISWISVDLTNLLIKKNIKIKMPDSVPPAVTAPFEALIPMAVNLVVFYIVNQLIIGVSGEAFPSLIINILSPLFTAIDSLPGVILLVTGVNVLWWFGINGASIVNGATQAFTLAFLAENAAALASGEPMTRITAFPFYCVFGNIGGAGATLAFIVIAVIFAKSAQMKAISKVAIIPQLFNINEPVTYGLPTVMNPFLLVPYIGVPIINITIAYLATWLGLVGKVYINAPWSMPGPLLAFFATLDWRAVILWALLFAMDLALWLPFMKAYDKYLLEKEGAHE